MVSREQSRTVHTSATEIRSPSLEELWLQALQEDSLYKEVSSAVCKGARKFPSILGLKVSIAECSLSEAGHLQFRGRRWVPDSEPLYTALIQYTHDSILTGYPGREVTSTLMMQQFFWLNMLQDIQRFVQNCDVCRRMKAWRDRKQGFLKPLPVPSQL